MVNREQHTRGRRHVLVRRWPRRLELPQSREQGVHDLHLALDPLVTGATHRTECLLDLARYVPGEPLMTIRELERVEL